MKAAARQELGVWGSIAKPFCREASPKVTQRSGMVMNTPLLIMENIKPVFSNTCKNFETTWRLFWDDFKENF